MSFAAQAGHNVSWRSGCTNLLKMHLQCQEKERRGNKDVVATKVTTNVDVDTIIDFTIAGHGYRGAAAELMQRDILRE